MRVHRPAHDLQRTRGTALSRAWAYRPPAPDHAPLQRVRDPRAFRAHTRRLMGAHAPRAPRAALGFPRVLAVLERVRAICSRLTRSTATPTARTAAG